MSIFKEPGLAARPMKAALAEANRFLLDYDCVIFGVHLHQL